uniref:Uncharacterized protein n=1 Tax=Oryza sativa subsp. japonica TaxID=39947 RepID=Q69TU7_ORYSJ|nr:hypothetical protein [Oryza sativa Japonica Group]BAD35730.1 hypothetical protein [Oryza sativa Japonica Group]
MAWRPGGEAAFDRGVVAGRRGGRADLDADVQTTWSGLSSFLLWPPRCGPSGAARQWRAFQPRTGDKVWPLGPHLAVHVENVAPKMALLPLRLNAT